ncbi:hypothetical protein Ae168Ps1_6026c [Pseudonocardia sp. Ae168_Ps1]|nr:hypothetical protein Ae168Ps1_6026c [Pseudonocardia sp. Ae168_Ps1]OLL76930.1 hypothetical protein Ae150APs1_5308 [Pseudonocardia sp. Ae150A_Ps1]OLL88957.1 hypothetical protein Ae263Ps1_6012c [Pseudonocardia sp. Ae263_Ps1]OLL91017.1 hypothetical protein Ae356Ps1_0914 [Pseudonocardia sp. Ae356_Ps1]
MTGAAFRAVAARPVWTVDGTASRDGGRVPGRAARRPPMWAPARPAARPVLPCTD